MKLIIPPEIKMGPITLRIVKSDKLLEKLNYRSSTNVKEEIIRLSSDRSVEQIFAGLLHEVLHNCEDFSGIGFEEREIISISNFLAQALLSMGIEPDFSQVPEEE